jgi:hypothetical protein
MTIPVDYATYPFKLHVVRQADRGEAARWSAVRSLARIDCTLNSTCSMLSLQPQHESAIHLHSEVLKLKLIVPRPAVVPWIRVPVVVTLVVQMGERIVGFTVTPMIPPMVATMRRTRRGHAYQHDQSQQKLFHKNLPLFINGYRGTFAKCGSRCRLEVSQKGSAN